jgi:mannosyltransferase
MKKYFPIILVSLLGLLVRLYNITAISLWHDEAFSALLIKYSWGEMIHRIGLDVHPPMYYFFLRLWSYVFGNSLLSLRGMSVFFGVATIVATYFLVKEIFTDKRLAIIASVLVAVNPFQIQYVTEARMYTMGAFFAVLGTYALVKALRNQNKYYAAKRTVTRANVIIPHLIFALSCAIMMLTHYYLLFTVAALGLYALWFHIKDYTWHVSKYRWLIMSGIIIVASFIPWLSTFLFQYKQVGAGYWIPPMDYWSIPRTLYEMLIKIAEPSRAILVILSIITLWIIVRVLRKTKVREKWLILVTFIAPFLGAILFFLLAKLQGEKSSVYLIRYFIFASTAYLILIAVFLESFIVKRIRTAVILLLVAVNLFSVGYYWNQLEVKTKGGMGALSQYINANASPSHKVFVASSFEFFNFKYYNHTRIAPLLFSAGQTDIHSMPHYAGTAILANEDLVPDFAQATAGGDTVWMIWTNGFDGHKPDVPKNWTEVDEHGFAEVRPYVGTWVIVTQYRVN